MRFKDSVKKQYKDSKEIKNMRRILKNIICGLALSTVLVAAPVAVESASAQVQDGLNMTKTADTQNTSVDTLIRNVINILLWAIGIVSVIMIIIGGFRYVTSNGDSSQVTAAKNTIMYSVIGLIIAIFAYGIVNFVVFRVGGIAITQEQQEQQKAQQGS